jgi:hypothetical protein
MAGWWDVVVVLTERNGKYRSGGCVKWKELGPVLCRFDRSVNANASIEFAKIGVEEEIRTSYHFQIGSTSL